MQGHLHHATGSVLYSPPAATPKAARQAVHWKDVVNEGKICLYLGGEEV
jgi:hypothetical protein